MTLCSDIVVTSRSRRFLMDSRGISATYQRSRGSVSGSSCALSQPWTQRCALCTAGARLTACRPQTRWRRSSPRSIGTVTSDRLRSRCTRPSSCGPGWETAQPGGWPAPWNSPSPHCTGRFTTRSHRGRLIRTFAQHVLTATLLRLAGEDELPADTEAIDRDLAEDIVARDIPLSEITQALRSMQREWLSLLIDAAVGVRSRRHRRRPGLGDIGYRNDGCVDRRSNRCDRRGAPACLPGRAGSRSERDRIAGDGRARGCRSGHTVAADPAGRLAPRLRHRSTSGRRGRAASPGWHRAPVRSGGRQRTDAAIRDERWERSTSG